MVNGLQAFSYGLLHRVKGWTKEQIEVCHELSDRHNLCLMVHRLILSM
jgi:hypothetical protein